MGALLGVDPSVPWMTLMITVSNIQQELQAAYPAAFLLPISRESFHLFGRLAGRCLWDFMTTKFPWKYGLVYQVLNKRPIGCKTCVSKHSNRIPSICVYNSPGLWTKVQFLLISFLCKSLGVEPSNSFFNGTMIASTLRKWWFSVSFVSVQKN